MRSSSSPPPAPPPPTLNDTTPPPSRRRRRNCSEETRCRFCDQVLPDWRPALTPQTLQPKPSIMSVRYK
jgi:hypothetical protein